ncbi:MAG: LysE family translocator [Pseudonocardiales bacterium]|nr:MAG: LysE family translocator [Pseudonocardiales bacterium]
MTAAVLTFIATATLLIVAPGPDSLLVARNVFRGGRRGGIGTAAGTLTGLSAWSVAAALGLSALLAASRVGYDALRVAGGIYLIWLGVQSLRSRGTVIPQTDSPSEHTIRPGLGRAYLSGVVSNVLNPKIGVFFVAFLPGFIPEGAPIVATAALLGALFVAETGVWLAVLVWLVGRGAGWLSRRGVQRWLERVTGVVLIGFGVRLVAEAH